MPERSYRVFISYSRRNEDRKKRFLTHLSTLKAEGLVTVWHDRCIEAGDLWRTELDYAMREAEVAIFLVSADFIASSFCQDVEVPEMLRRHRDEGVLIIPVIVDYCQWQHIERISQFQALPEGGKPVPALKPQDRAWTQVIAGLRQRLLEKPPAKRPPAAAVAPTPPVKPHSLSLATLLRELPGESGDLFGRDEALGWLDAAYTDPQTGVLALVGFGGVGKSALVRHWLETRFRPEDPTPRFLGVSFYSQGTREQAGSSDQFIIQALETFGEENVGQKSSWDRGELLAQHVAAEPTVLVLDGLEPLQHGRGPHNLEGRLKDPGVHALLARLAKQPGKSLCVVSTRLELTDEDLRTPSCIQKSVEVLSPEAARELLRARGVRGSDEELDDAAEYLGHHPLALLLAAEYLHTFAEGEVRKLREISLVSEKTKEGRHAKSVMAAYETALRLDGDPLDLEILGVVGLFDRPTRWPWLKALAAPPAIAGVTDHLVRATDTQLRESINRLRQWGMLADPGSIEEPDLDAHPLIREYFGERLRAADEPGWCAAHSRIFDYLTSTTKEFPDTLEEMEPLFQAIAHGCAAGRHQEALYAVYYKRINMTTKAFLYKSLGAFSAGLATLIGFFDPPWEPVHTFSETDKAFLLNEAGFVLRALGRSPEATQTMLAALERHILKESWKNAAISATNLSETYLVIGNLAQALTYARRGIDLADRSGDTFQQRHVRARLAAALHHSGKLAEAESTFQEAERRQKEEYPEFPFLYSLSGYQFCDLLLSQRKYSEVQVRTAQTLKWANQYIYDLLNLGLEYLSLGRVTLRQAQLGAAKDFTQAINHLNQAVTVLRQAGRVDYLSRGLLARAELHRVIREFDRARGDLDEAMSLIARGGMGLHEADCHLEYARLCVAEGKGEEARGHWVKAKEMVGRMGYHLRDGDVREIKALLKDGEGEEAG